MASFEKYSLIARMRQSKLGEWHGYIIFPVCPDTMTDYDAICKMNEINKTHEKNC